MINLTDPLAPEEFRSRLYDGEMFCLRKRPTVQAIIEATQKHAEACLAPLHPTKAHESLSRAELIETFGQYRRSYQKNTEIQSLWRAFFTSLGFDPDNTACDRTLARVQTPFERSEMDNSDLVTAPLAFHRDTWGSNLYAQINWWAPVYPITQDRTMQMYPQLWDRPLENTSAEFDLPTVIQNQRKTGRRQSTPDEHIPHLSEDIADLVAVPVVIDPGDVFVFSGAHAHGSVRNTSDLTRLSLETRTVDINDLQSGRGAPNLDGHAKWMAPGWFRRMSDGTAMNELLGVDVVTQAKLPKFAKN